MIILLEFQQSLGLQNPLRALEVCIFQSTSNTIKERKFLCPQASLKYKVFQVLMENFGAKQVIS